MYKRQSLESRPGWCAPFGEYCGYTISVIEDEQQDIRVMLDHMDGEVVDTTTARGIIYADPKMTYDGATLQSETISIRSGTNVADAFPQLVDSGEAAKTVVTLDADAKSVSVAIQKVIIKKIIKDSFFEDKIYFLLGLKEKTNQKILDNNLFNFYLSHITSNNFEYQPEEKTDKYIWRYLSSSNLIKIDSFEDEEVILTYEKAAAV